MVFQSLRTIGHRFVPHQYTCVLGVPLLFLALGGCESKSPHPTIVETPVQSEPSQDEDIPSRFRLDELAPTPNVPAPVDSLPESGVLYEAWNGAKTKCRIHGTRTICPWNPSALYSVEVAPRTSITFILSPGEILESVGGGNLGVVMMPIDKDGQLLTYKTGGRQTLQIKMGQREQRVETDLQIITNKRIIPMSLSADWENAGRYAMLIEWVGL